MKNEIIDNQNNKRETQTIQTEMNLNNLQLFETQFNSQSMIKQGPLHFCVCFLCVLHCLYLCHVAMIICSQKMYGLYGLLDHIVEINGDVKDVG